MYFFSNRIFSAGLLRTIKLAKINEATEKTYFPEQSLFNVIKLVCYSEHKTGNKTFYQTHCPLLATKLSNGFTWEINNFVVFYGWTRHASVQLSYSVAFEHLLFIWKVLTKHKGASLDSNDIQYMMCKFSQQNRLTVTYTLINLYNHGEILPTQPTNVDQSLLIPVKHYESLHSCQSSLLQHPI